MLSISGELLNILSDKHFFSFSYCFILVYCIKIEGGQSERGGGGRLGLKKSHHSRPFRGVSKGYWMCSDPARRGTGTRRPTRKLLRCLYCTLCRLFRVLSLFLLFVRKIVIGDLNEHTYNIHNPNGHRYKASSPCLICEYHPLPHQWRSVSIASFICFTISEPISFLDPFFPLSYPLLSLLSFPPVHSSR